MSRLATLALAIALVGALATPAAATPAEDQARADFAQGRLLVDGGDLEGALARFRDAYARWPQPAILINISWTLVQLDRLVEAADTYARYLEVSADEALKRDIAIELARLDARLGQLTFAAIAPGTVVTVDGTARGTAPIAAVRVLSGPHDVELRSAAGAPIVVAVVARPGEVTAVHAPAPPAVAVARALVDRADVRLAPPPPARSGPGPWRIVGRVVLDGDDLGRGAAVAPGVGLAGDHVELAIGAVIGPTLGAWANATWSPWTWRARPYLLAGAAVFEASSVTGHVLGGLRGAVGVEGRVIPRLALFAELGVEHVLGAPADTADTTFVETLLVPVLGVKVSL